MIEKTPKLKPWPEETCGHYTRRARFHHNLSQVELAELTGIDQTNISAFENDRFRPSMERINRISAVLPVADVQVMALLAGRATEETVKTLLGDLSWLASDISWIEEPVGEVADRVAR